jgi:hypothetical protein
MTYTKEPWHICNVTGRGLRIIRDANDYCVAEAVKPANSGAAYIDADANAALISAAPEMLSALETIVSNYPYWASKIQMKEIDNVAIAMAKAAIAKARGELA